MSMANHTSTQPNPDELFSAYLDGELSETEREQVSAIARSDPEAAASLNQLSYVVDLLAQVPRQPLPRAFTLAAEQVTLRRRPVLDLLAWLRPTLLRGATALVVLCLVFLVVGDLSYQPQRPEATIPTATGEQSPSPVDEGQVEQLQAKRDDSDMSTSPASATAMDQALSRSDASAQAFLGLEPKALLALEIGLAFVLVLLLLAQWQLSRTP